MKYQVNAYPSNKKKDTLTFPCDGLFVKGFQLVVVHGTNERVLAQKEVDTREWTFPGNIACDGFGISAFEGKSE